MKISPFLIQLTSSIAVGAFASAARAGPETTTHTYDELGRLIETRVSGGPRGGVVNSMSFDPAGNRITVAVSGAAGGRRHRH